MQENTSFWNFFKDCIWITTHNILNVSLEHIIYGWNIRDLNFDFVNLLIVIATFSIYKARVRYNETNIFNPISRLFSSEIERLNEIIINTGNVPKIINENKTAWNELKVHLNIL